MYHKNNRILHLNHQIQLKSALNIYFKEIKLILNKRNNNKNTLSRND